MKLRDDEKRKRVWEALFKADGDRPRAAEEMGVSLRTLARYMSELDLLEQSDRMGWTKRNGPPRAVPKGTSMVRQRVLAFLDAHGGAADIGAMALHVFGQDDVKARKDLYAALEDLHEQRVLKTVEGRLVRA